MRVLVIHEHVPKYVRLRRVAGDLRFIMVVKTDTMSMISPIVTFEGKGAEYDSNPYLVYGDACAEFTGLDKLSLSIEVAGIHSGDLKGWL